MTPKTQKFQKKLAEKFWENISTFLFKKFQPKFLDLGQKTVDFTRFWGKKYKKIIFCQ